MEILEYKAQLEQKLATVNAIIAEMGVTAPKKRGRKPGKVKVEEPMKAAGRPKGKGGMSAAGKAAVKAAMKARWAAARKAGKTHL
jgi:hypothetical protein